jgi:hypothetical protein
MLGLGCLLVIIPVALVIYAFVGPTKKPDRDDEPHYPIDE